MITDQFIREYLTNDSSSDAVGVLADMLEEQQHPSATRMRDIYSRLHQAEKDDGDYGGSYYLDYTKEDLDEFIANKELSGDDWREAFTYAGKEHGRGRGTPERALPNDDILTTPFGRADVKCVIASAEGANDGENWVVVGELYDGRYFALSAGCDYTGWD